MRRLDLEELRRPLTPAEEAYEAQATAELEMDPRIETLSLYIVGDLPPGEMAAVERRLEEDAEYRAFAQPLLLLRSLFPLTPVAPSEASEAVCRRVESRLRGRDERGVPLLPTGHSRREIMGRRMSLAAIETAVILVGGFLLAWYVPPYFLEPRHVAISEQTGAALVDGGLEVRAGAGGWAQGPRKADSTGRHVFRGEGRLYWRVRDDARGAYELLTPSARIMGGRVTLEVDASVPMRTVVTVKSGAAIVESRGLEPPVSLRAGAGDAVIVEHGKAPQRRAP